MGVGVFGEEKEERIKKIRLVGDRWVGEGEYPFIVAEKGKKHNGSMEIAKKLMDKAKEIGVDAVKFQKKDIETAFRKELLDKPYFGHHSFGKTYREHKQFLEFSKEEIKQIKEYCDKIGIIFFCTPFDVKSVQDLEEIGNPIYKIASFHVTNLNLIEAICRTGKPIVMSTGMSTIEEVDRAVDLIRRYTENFVLLHCVSAYPADERELNLRTIKTLKERYNCPVGYSGHERGVALCAATIMLGACIIERHFTLDRTMKGPDHALSVEPTGMSLIVRRSKYFFESLGDGRKRVLESELKTRRKFRGY